MPSPKLFQVITIFPDIIEHYATASILGRGQKAAAIKVEAINLRDFTTGAHRTVDDSPYGGGPGMVLKPEPIFKAVEKTRPVKNAKTRVILMDPRGSQFSQKKAHELTQFDQLIFIAGRYEGVDERVRQHIADESISIGPYVLSGGELAALVIIEAVARLVPGVLGKEESLAEESFSKTERMLEYPQYTKPADFQGHTVPEILLSGDHAKIAEWRKKQSSL
jgi:tRNA (guanine37-N1)-methyltransferase